jgi:hypothetical protein
MSDGDDVRNEPSSKAHFDHERNRLERRRSAGEVSEGQSFFRVKGRQPEGGK